MRKFLLIGALLAPALASAETVYVQTAKGHQCVGDKFQIGAAQEVLYRERACELPLAHAKDLRAYSFKSVAGPALELKGCWGNRLDGSFIVVRQDGSQSYAPPNAYVSAKLNGSYAVVTDSPNQGSRYAKAVGMCN